METETIEIHSVIIKGLTNEVTEDDIREFLCMAASKEEIIEI